MPNARNTDPSTSHEAAASVLALSHVHHGIIIGAMRTLRDPVASEQISFVTELTHAQVWRRMSELEKHGLVAKTALKHTNVSGRSAFKYALIPQLGS